MLFIIIIFFLASYHLEGLSGKVPLEFYSLGPLPMTWCPLLLLLAVNTQDATFFVGGACMIMYM